MMNRKERRRLEKEAQKQTRASGQNSSPNHPQSAPAGISNVLFNHAMNSTASQNTNELDWEVQNISDQLSEGFTGDALKSCKRLQSQHPDNPNIQLLSGIAYFMNQQWPKAAKCFEAVISHEPENAQALNYLGDLAIEQKNLEGAENYYRQAAKIQPEDQNTLHRLAYILQRQENIAEAAEIYRQLLKNDPTSADIHLNYGYALFKNGQTTEAIKEYRTAINLNPGFGLAYINLGSALSEIDEDQGAIAAFKQGLKILPAHVDGLFGLARCLRAQDEYHEAVKSFRKALKLAPDRTQTLWELGYSLELSGDKKGGQKAYEECLKHHPNHSVAQHLLDSLIGNTTEAAPQDYIEELFDDYASSFDDSLVNELNYIVPKLLKAHLDKLGLAQPIRSVLDLGGGTGLVTKEIKIHTDPDSAILHGVDLSSGMIDVANQNNRYSETFVSDIVEFLEDEKIGLAQYELIIAGDVFVYIGNLEQVFAGVYKRLKNNGLYLFTVEQSSDDNYKLQPTGRYAHSKNYIQEIAQKFNFNISNIEEITPRKDGEHIIDGFLVCLKKP